MQESLIQFVRDVYQTKEFVPLHEPTFGGNERAYVDEAIKSTFVSSVGKFVDEFEVEIENFTGAPKAVATVNGTAALHAALYIAGVGQGDLVLTQALTFVATCNSLFHLGAEPIFVDVSEQSLGLCPKAVSQYLEECAVVNEDGRCIHKSTGKPIKAVMPMHTFGHPVELDELLLICEQWNLRLIEDAAESLGSYYKGQHTGTVGHFGALSFNGNKVITTGGGGVLLAQNAQDGARAKHVTTTAKVQHSYEFFHDEPGFNYRMPNLNAALGCAQIEGLPALLRKKRELATQYRALFEGTEFRFVLEPEYAESNYWLNAVVCPDATSRDELLKETNSKGVMTRPVWALMNRLPMFKECLKGALPMSEFFEERIVNIPSTPPRELIEA